MKNRVEYPECPFEHHDCFALTGVHQCWCLDDTNFGKRDCPFYKPDSEISHEIMMKKYREQKARGRTR